MQFENRSQSILFEKPPRGVFILGSDTEVGKTYVSSLILTQISQRIARVGAYKPVASGAVQTPSGVRWEDSDALLASLPTQVSIDLVTPQRFLAPLAPPIAAKLEGKEVDETLIRNGLSQWRTQCEWLLVEGAGGIFSPISKHMTAIDLAIEVNYPAVIVVANKLGAVSQALQALFVAQKYRGGVNVAALVLNSVSHGQDTSVTHNASMLREFCSVPVYELAHGSTTLPETLVDQCLQLTG